MVLVDTSSWIETLRAGGSVAVRQRVSKLVLDGEAAWCDMIRLELWHGVRTGRETNDLAELDEVVVTVPIDADVWQLAIALARRSRSKGLTVQAPDLIIAAAARRHQMAVDSLDSHLERLMKINLT